MRHFTPELFVRLQDIDDRAAVSDWEQASRTWQQGGQLWTSSVNSFAARLWPWPCPVTTAPTRPSRNTFSPSPTCWLSAPIKCPLVKKRRAVSPHVGYYTYGDILILEGARGEWPGSRSTTCCGAVAS